MGSSSFRVRGFRVPGRALFQRHPGGIGFHTVVYDAEGRAVDYTFDAVNPAFERLTGLEAHDVVVRFTNNGPTVAPEDRPHLFTRFFTTKAEPGAKGTGLGLSFSQSVIVSHGGALTLEEGTETTFQVRLPRAGS